MVLDDEIVSDAELEGFQRETIALVDEIGSMMSQDVVNGETQEELNADGLSVAAKRDAPSSFTG